MQSVSSNAVARALTQQKIKVAEVYKVYSAPTGTDSVLTDPSNYPKITDIPNATEFITYIPTSIRPIQSWAQCPVQFYVDSSHTWWVIRSLGTYNGDFEVQWSVFYI